MPVARSLEALVEQLLARVAELETVLAQRDLRIAELERQLGADSSNSSRPPSSDAPWAKKAAKKRSLRTKSGRKRGKQPGAASVSRSVADDPDEVFEVAPDRCAQCDASLAGAEETARLRRQVIDTPPPTPPTVTEYQLVSRRCGGCGHVSEPTINDVPGPVTFDTAGHPGTGVGDRTKHSTDTATDSDSVAATGVHPGMALVLRPGSPVRIGPRSTALAALLTCGHYLPITRARSVLATLAGARVSTGFTAGVRERAAILLETTFLPHMRALLPTAPVLHADETTVRAAGALAYVHVACTQYLTLMHVGGRSSDGIDAGGVLPEFTGILMRDGYAGYTHLPATHAWCGAHLVRDLRAISDGDSQAQMWALAMADTLLDAN